MQLACLLGSMLVLPGAGVDDSTHVATRAHRDSARIVTARGSVQAMHDGAMLGAMACATFRFREELSYEDDEIERIAVAEGRIVLSRDRGLLKRRHISHAMFVRAVWSPLREVFDRLDLTRGVRPFSCASRATCRCRLRAARSR